MYRHWMEHRGSEGLADLLEPTPTVTAQPQAAAIATPNETRQHVAQLHPHHHVDNHPDIETTPEDMARLRPDLTTGELKMPE